MAQNIYDNTSFFNAYSNLPRSLHGFSGMPEWGKLQGLLPDLRNQQVLDIGSGFGWFARYAIQNGASAVLGIELSDNMLAKARAFGEDSKIVYRKGDLFHIGEIDFGLTFNGNEDKSANMEEMGRFSCVVSILVLHYLPNEIFDDVVSKVWELLQAGGTFVAEVEHPILTAPSHPSFIPLPSHLLNQNTIQTRIQDENQTLIKKDNEVDLKEPRAVWPLDNYELEGQRSVRWLADGVVKYHRTVGGYLNVFLRRGFILQGFEEWCGDTSRENDTNVRDSGGDRPAFLLMRLGKPT